MNKTLSLFIVTAFFSLSAGANHHEGHNHQGHNHEGHNHQGYKHEGAKARTIHVEKSKIVWTGEKKFVEDSHSGTVNLKSGKIYFKKGVPVHGDFVIDMNSIKVTDIKDPADRKKLLSHLNSEDFFDVKNHSEAKFSFNSVRSLGNNQYALTGEMEIREVKHTETIQATIVLNPKDKSFKVTADVVINRTKYGVSYNAEGSNSNSWFFVRWFKGGVKAAKDKIIKNDLNLSIELVAEK